MPIITIINPKGGVGKTTITLNLGLFISSFNKQVIFIDLDPQYSLYDWLKRRPATLTQYQCTKSNYNKLTKEGFPANDDDTYYIIDCPASISSQDISQLMNLSDMLLIPTMPSPVDLTALTRFFFQLAANEQYKVEEKKIALIINRAKVYTRGHSDIIKKIEKYKIPLIATLRDTQNYTIPSARGMGLVDLPSYRVKDDLKSWSGIFKWLKLEEPIHQ